MKYTFPIKYDAILISAFLLSATWKTEVWNVFVRGIWLHKHIKLLEPVHIGQTPV